MRIGVLGSGSVAQTLAAGFLQQGHEVLVGTRDTSKLSEWLRRHHRASAAGFAEAAAFGDVVILAVKGSAASRVLRVAGTPNLKDKVVIDVCNPLAEGAPVNGVQRYFTALDDSLMERLQKEFSTARFVKAFNSVGVEVMVQPALAGGPPSMFICGNHADGKRIVGELLRQLGWEPVDLGMAEAARAIEPLAILWNIPALLHGARHHAFSLLRDARPASAP